MKTTIFIFLLLSMISCATFEKTNNKNVQLNIEKLNGKYSIFAMIQNNNKPYHYNSYYFNNANENFYHKYGRGEWDTIKYDTLTGGEFSVKILDKKRIVLNFYRKSQIVKSLNLKYKLKDNWLYLKNKNFLFAGIPYIYGGIDIKKVRIGVNNRNNLIINTVNNSSGALLFIIGDAKKWEYINEYKRIE